jgi:hypothetical protein
VSSEASTFSLVAGGPLFRLLRRLHLVNDQMEFLFRRVLVACAVAWLPLAFLSVAGGRAWGSAVRIPFFSDIDLHARVLLALPLLLAAERLLFNRMRWTLPEFLRRELVPEAELPKFESAIASARRWRDSGIAGVVIILIVYFVGVLYLWRNHFALPVATWYAIPSGAGNRLTAAGWWYALITIPIVQFTLLRWYYRIVIWARLLWQISRLHLELIPTHPDHCGGLGFLSTAMQGFMLFLFAQGVFMSGAIANRIFFAGARLVDFKVELAAFTILSLLLVLGPSLVLAPALTRAKRAGRREYGGLAEQYVRDFDRKWLRGERNATEQLLGHTDIQSLADLGNSYELIRRARQVPFTQALVFELAVAALMPVAPLLLTMFPIEAIIEHVVKMIF